MTARLPKGADLLADIRRQGYRPAGQVFVFLDADWPRPKIYSDTPLTVEICIRPGDPIDGLDLRPLVGLDVAIHGGGEVNDRLRALLKAVVQARPQFLMGCVPADRFIFAYHPVRGWEYAHVE